LLYPAEGLLMKSLLPLALAALPLKLLLPLVVSPTPVLAVLMDLPLSLPPPTDPPGLEWRLRDRLSPSPDPPEPRRFPS